MEKINEVTAVTLNILKKNPPLLEVNSSGMVRSGGWTNGQLEAFVYITPPADGLYEFNFVADPPTGASTDAMTPIYAPPFLWDDFPMELKGVKVYALQNSLISKL